MEENKQKIEPTMTLYRGCSESQAAIIINNQTAGGAEPNEACGAPSETEATTQAGSHEMASYENKITQIASAIKLLDNKPSLPINKTPINEDLREKIIDKLKAKYGWEPEKAKTVLQEWPSEEQAVSETGVAEYSSSYDVASRWARTGVLISVTIETRYLREGNPANKGWFCYNAAPVTKTEILD